MKTEDQAALVAGTKLERLNAAAPDLLSVLAKIVERFADYKQRDIILLLAEARAAIAKATK